MRIYRRYHLILAILAALLVTSLGYGCANSPTTEKNSRSNASDAHQDLAVNERQADRQPTRTSSGKHSHSGDTVAVTTGRRPSWVDGDSRQYPQKDYITGVGYATNRQNAEDNARAEISKIFYARIQSRSRVYQQYLQTGNTENAETRLRVNIEEMTKVSTRKVLSGVRIAQIYRESGSEKIYYALAVLERRQAQHNLTYQIQELDREILRLLNEAEDTDDTLIKVKLLKRCLESFLQRQLYDAELRIVDPGGKGISPQASFTDIHSLLSKTLLHGFWIGVLIEGNRASEIRQALVEAFNQKGFAVIADNQKAHVLARGSTQITPIDQGPSQWKFVRWKVNFNLIDQRGGAAFGSVTKTGKEGHLTLSQAEERAVQKIQKTLAPDLAEQLTRFIYRQSAQPNRSN